MVTVTSFCKREGADGKEFNALILEGDVEMILSTKSGKYYATTKSCSITSTLHEVMCQRMIGRQLPGTIEKVECEPYEFTIPGTEEVITLKHTYFYQPSNDPEEKVIPINQSHEKPSEPDFIKTAA